VAARREQRLRIEQLETKALEELGRQCAAKASYAAERLTELGFEVTGMFPVTRDRDLLRVVEFDCVLRRVGREVPAG
jgi:hypothetical protein